MSFKNSEIKKIKSYASSGIQTRNPWGLNFIYFTTITKQVIQIILIMLVGTDVYVPVVFEWEETGVSGGNPPGWLGDHMNISHTNAAYWTRVAAVRGERVTTAPARQPRSLRLRNTCAIGCAKKTAENVVNTCITTLVFKKY